MLDMGGFTTLYQSGLVVMVVILVNIIFFSDVRPVRKALLCFFFGISFIRHMLCSHPASVKMFFLVFMCMSIFMGYMILIINNNEKYRREVEPLIYFMFNMCFLTGVLVLVMDYQNSKETFESIIVYGISYLLTLIPAGSMAIKFLKEGEKD